MEGLWSATLDSHSPRYEQWKRILGGDDVPLHSPACGETQLGQEKAEVYLLDWTRMNLEQRERLIEFVGNKFGTSRGEIVAEIEKTNRFPIREADVTLAFSLRAFL